MSAKYLENENLVQGHELSAGGQIRFKNGCSIIFDIEDGVFWGADPYGQDSPFDAEDDWVSSVNGWLSYWSESRDEAGQLIDGEYDGEMADVDWEAVDVAFATISSAIESLPPISIERKKDFRLAVFNLHSDMMYFDSPAKSSGFNDYIGEFPDICPYDAGSEDALKWREGFDAAKNNPHVRANLDYYRSSELVNHLD